MNKIISFTLIISLLSLIKSEDSQNVLTEDKSVKTESYLTPYGVHIGGYFYTGDGSEHKGEDIGMEPVFGRKISTIGDSDSQKWGISCNETNTCSTTSEEQETDFYKSMMFTYKKASLYLRLENENVNVENKEKLPVQLVNGGNHWPLGSFGILGLSPRGDAGNYFRNLYTNDTSLLIHYKPKNNADSDTQMDFKADFILNPKIEEENVLVNFDFDDKAEFWMVNGSFEIKDTSIDFKNKQICLSNSDNNLIVTNDNFNQCEELQKKVCDGKIGKNCNKDNADLSLLTNLVITLNEVSVEFTPEEYMYYDSENNLNCRLGDPGDLRILDLCDRNTEFAIGKLFYQKYFPVLTFRKNSNSSFTFLKNYDFPSEDSSNFWLIFWWIVAIVVILAIIVFIVVLRKRKSNEKDDYRNIPVEN